MSVDLARPRDLGALLTDSLRVFFANFRVFAAIALVVVVPVDAVVFGIGLGQFSGHFDSTPPAAEDVVRILVRLLLTAPLVTLMSLYALLDLSEGRRPQLGRAIVRGLETFRAAFLPVAAAAAAAISIIGIPLWVRWYLVPQVVAIDHRNGREALDGSWELTRGYGWRTAGIILATNLVFGLSAALISQPLISLARSQNSEAILLGSTVLLELVIAAPVAIVSTLMFFDLRVRRGVG